MADKQVWGGAPVAATVAIVVGLLTAWFDVAAPFGDDTEKGTIALWLFSTGVLGFVWPQAPWHWALLAGICVPAVHMLYHHLGWSDSVHPSGYRTVLFLVPIALCVSLLGVYAGAFIGQRRHSP
jgi:hypothetical protein